MFGFVIIINKNCQPVRNTEVIWKKTMDFQPTYTLRSKNTDHIFVEQKTQNHFINDKLWLDNDKFFFMSEGLISNLDQLCSQNLVKNYEDLIYKLYQKKNFFNDFKGNFAGYIYDKETNTHQIFNNHTATKKVFYFNNDEYLICSTDLFSLTSKLKDLSIGYQLNVEASYMLLTNGFMLDNTTLIDEIKQIRAGEYLCLSKNRLVSDFYFHLNNIELNKDSRKETIHQLDDLFKKAVHYEYKLDEKYNFTGVTTLSGGLDSRMTAMISHQLGYHQQTFINFSEPGYADEIIAKQIAGDLNVKLLKFHLSAKGLTAIDDVVKINDGLNLYSGSGHSFEALRNYAIENVGLVHTGMIGDAVLGSFVSSPQENRPDFKSGTYSKALLNKAQPILEAYCSNYKNEEIYKFYNRAFLGANNGFLFFDLIGESSSPFLEPDFLSYAFSMPYEFKYKEKIYVEWIKTCHPEIAKYTWEAIGGKPTNSSLKRKIFRIKRAVIKRLPMQTIWKHNMNPEQLWYDKNPEVQISLNKYYQSNLVLLDSYPELQADVISLYVKGNITEKTQALTLLAAMKLLFLYEY